jgi:hypothetical protein
VEIGLKVKPIARHNVVCKEDDVLRTAAVSGETIATTYVAAKRKFAITQSRSPAAGIDFNLGRSERRVGIPLLGRLVRPDARAQIVMRRAFYRYGRRRKTDSDEANPLHWSALVDH